MTAQDSASPKPQLDNNTVRIITGLIVIPLSLFITYLGGWAMLLVLVFVVFVGTLEFYHMEKQRYQGANTVLGMVCGLLVLVGFFVQSSVLVWGSLLISALITFVVEYIRSRTLAQSAFRILTTLGGVFYLAVPAGCLLVIRAIPNEGLWWVYSLYLATWGTDTVAYFVGRQFGKTLLAPKLSPKKTVEGAVGGVIAGILFPFLLLLLVGQASLSAVVLVVLSPFVAIWGDLFESALKRFFGLKDSGIRGLNLFPGHGGVLDRVDALVWVTGLFYVYLLLIGRVGF